MLDLDNTVADREASFAAWLAEFKEEHGLPRDACDWIVDVDNDGYADRVEVFQAIRDRLELDPSVEQLLAKYQARVVELARPTPGALACLRQMRNRAWTLALVTNGSSGQQQGKIDVLGIRHLFDVVCVSAEVGVKKPLPEIFEMAADQAGHPLSDSWMVGDSPLNDIGGGQRLGMKTAWLSRGRRWPEGESPPSVSISSLKDLVPAIDRDR
ncbi:MAG: HAD family hydrolase [Actinomycetota bacterium]